VLHTVPLPLGQSFLLVFESIWTSICQFFHGFRVNWAIKTKELNKRQVLHSWAGSSLSLTAGFSIRAGSQRNSPAISHELAAYLIEKLPYILRLT